MPENNDTSGNIRFRDTAPAIEFLCWLVVLIVPVLRLINGPAVTNDQFVMQVATFSLALGGAISLRLYQHLRP
jgi:hypothetical protein